MRIIIMGALCVGYLFMGSIDAEAKGCIKGAIIGGIAGHFAGHGLIGAAGGCVAGRAASGYANKPRSVVPGNQPMQQRTTSY